MKIIKLFLILCLIQSLVSCSDWLDVTPTTEVRLNDQLSSAEGFVELLNGVYIAMAQRELYGEHLMFGDIEFLGQNHHPETGGATGYAEYDFEDTRSITRSDEYWANLYNAIANVNAILDNIDDRADLFTTDDFNLIKGEALALRAFLHFDALRLFGDRYTEASKSEVQIPYYESAELIRYPHLEGGLVYLKILDDLDVAQGLLSLSDPLVANYQGFLFDPADRIYHLNIFALLGIKARVFITRGDSEFMDYDSALHYSQRVINEASWDWVTFDVLEDNDNPDVLFSSEMLWTLNVSDLPTLYNQTFDTPNGYATAGGQYNGSPRIFEVGDGTGESDFRYFYLLENNVSDNFGRARSIKYNQEELFVGDQSSNPGTLYEFYCVPMLRIGEVWLMAAEVLLEGNRESAINMLNELKDSRRVVIEDRAYTGIFNNGILDIIAKEYRKELFLEGQTFFIYKRLGRTQIPDAISEDGMIDMIDDNYKLPIPFAELELGNR